MERYLSPSDAAFRPELVIVDDEPRVGEALAREIGLAFPDASFDTRVFTDPAACIAHLAAGPDQVFLIISDLRMPAMGGGELLVRARELCPAAQTILLTAYADIGGIQKAVSAAIQSLLLKPWTGETLLIEVRKAWESWSLRRDNARLRREMDLLLTSAGDFQRVLFAGTPPAPNSLSFDIAFQPHDAYHCGGDFYDIIELSDGGRTALLGDVAGHGPRAAMVAAMAKAASRALLEGHPGLAAQPGAYAAKLNDFFCSLMPPGTDLLVALSILHVDAAAERFTLVTAGQPPAILLQPDGSHTVGSGGHALGVLPGASFATASGQVAPGDVIVLHTDGLVESVTRGMRVDPAAAELGLGRLRGSSAATVCGHFRDLHPDQSFSDDVTLMAVRRE